MDRTYDVVVIGSGAAGTAVAMGVREHGRSVAVVDSLPFGGTCPLRGCDPKKVLHHAASVVDAAANLARHTVFSGLPALRWSDLVRFKRTFTDPIPAQREKRYRDAGVDALHGRARFEDVRTLRIDGDVVHAGAVAIAAGAKTLHVVPGDEALLTSTTFMDLEELPRSLVFVGAGYVAFEFAHIAARAGCRVTILHADAHPLRGFDPWVVAQLVDATREAGIDVRLETRVKSVERTSGGVAVRAESGNETLTFAAEGGVLAAGRVPDIDDMALEAGGVERTRHGVRVNEYLQSTSNPHVYAAGDAADGGGLPLTPVAGYEGEVVAANLAGGNHTRANFAGLASMVYSLPPMGAVGETESQARNRGADVELQTGDMSEWYQTRYVAGLAACYKVVLDKGTRKILGATILGPHAQEQINVLALAIRHGLTVTDVSPALFGYPSGASDLEYILGAQ